MIKFPSFEVLISTGHLSQSHAIAQSEMKDLMLAMPIKSSLTCTMQIPKWTGRTAVAP